MITDELLQYIKKEQGRGVSDAEIRHELLRSGWKKEDVDAALQARIPEEPTPLPTTGEGGPQVGLSNEQAVAEVKKLGKFKGSKMIFTQSLGIIRKDKEILLFPFFSAIVSLVLCGLYIGGTFFFGIVDIRGEDVYIDNEILFYGSLLVYYVLTYFFITYFKVGLTAIAYERMNGRDIGFHDGTARANAIIGKIFMWSLVAGTVGVVLKVISDRSKLLGRVVVSFIGAAWNIVTFFIAPTLLLDNVSVGESIKNSAEVFKKTWGETLITTVSLSFISGLIAFGFMVMWFIVLVVAISLGAGIGIVLGLGGVLLIGIIFISILSSSLQEVFKVALYSYARFGVIAEGFSPEVVVGALGKKN